MTVDLEEQELQAVMGMIALAPWKDANPLLMRIGSQLREQPTGKQFRAGAATNPNATERAGTNSENPSKLSEPNPSRV